MSLRNNLLGILGGSVALTVTFGLAERVQAQATAPSPVLYVNAVGGTYNRTRAQAMNPATPYDTITHACQNALANDTIEVAPGTYTDAANISNCHTLTIRPKAGTIPIIKGSSSNNYGIVKIDGSDHILFSGFEVDGTGAGPDVGGIIIVPRSGVPSHDIQVKYCKVHDAGGGGIGSNSDATYTIGCDYIQITGNEIYHCASTGQFNGSGISLHEDRNFNTSDTGFHSTVQNNNIHDNINVNPNASLHTDGNGIIIDTEQGGASNSPKVLVQNNLVYRNGGRGIHVFESSNVTVLNNTVYGNSLDPKLTGTRGELVVVTADNVLFSNNLVQGNGLAPAFTVGTVYGTTNGPNLHFKNNTYGGAGTNAGTAIDWPTTIYFDPSTVTVFVNASINDFHLRSLSPNVALNKGSNAAGMYSYSSIDGVTRNPAGGTPPGGAVDRGAYEQ